MFGSPIGKPQPHKKTTNYAFTVNRKTTHFIVGGVFPEKRMAENFQNELNPKLIKTSFIRKSGSKYIVYINGKTEKGYLGYSNADGKYF